MTSEDVKQPATLQRNANRPEVSRRRYPHLHRRLFPWTRLGATFDVKEMLKLRLLSGKPITAPAECDARQCTQPRHQPIEEGDAPRPFPVRRVRQRDPERERLLGLETGVHALHAQEAVDQ